jgi:hypothetical protein
MYIRVSCENEFFLNKTKKKDFHFYDIKRKRERKKKNAKIFFHFLYIIRKLSIPISLLDSHFYSTSIRITSHYHYILLQQLSFNLPLMAL